jgi:hypothetical protein
MSGVLKLITFLDSGEEIRTWKISSFLFLRLLGLLYFFVFLDIWAQIIPLLGSEGVIPYTGTLDAIYGRFAEVRVDRVPTLLWFFNSDWILHVLCGAACFFSLLLVAGFLQGLANFLIWIIFLSISTVGNQFFSTPGDLLLLELGFIVLLFAPWRFYSPWSKWNQPTRIVRWLFRWLLFRIIFESGIIKITSEDPIWFPNFTALYFYYFTQPLPNWIAWYVHQLPMFIHKLMGLFVVAIQLVFSFCILGTGIYRWAIFILIGFLQLFIGICGEFGAVNILAFLLSLFLLDDKGVRVLMPRRYFRDFSSNHIPSIRYIQVGFVSIIFLIIFPGTLLNLSNSIYPYWSPPERVTKWYTNEIAPYRIINRYSELGLIRSFRNEVLIQGSNDGKLWKDYEFNAKPGAVYRRPYFIFMHFPRLEWQFWNIATHEWNQSPWLIDILYNILKGNKGVKEIISTDPFPDVPPRYVRLMISRYEFSGPRVKWNYGHWWDRSEPVPFSPVMSLGL